MGGGDEPEDVEHLDVPRSLDVVDWYLWAQEPLDEGARILDVAAMTAYALNGYFRDMPLQQLEMLIPQHPQILDKLLQGQIFVGGQWVQGRLEFDVQTRAKLLEVALLRGGSQPYVALEEARDNWLVQQAVGMDEEQAGHAAWYQKMAMDAVLGGEPELFQALSHSSQVVPPDGRHPASQWMHIMLQKGGLMADPALQYQVHDWIKDLPPEIRDTATKHLNDAAAKPGPRNPATDLMLDAMD